MGSVDASVLVRRVISVTPKRKLERHTMFLNNIDQRFGYSVRDLFFFSNSPGLDVLVEKLEEGLSKVLEHYSCWAGRLKVNELNRLEIECNSKGALLAAAVTDMSFDEITESDHEKFFLEPPEDLQSLDDLTLLNVQVTHVERSNGYVVSVLHHHTLAEATSAIYFLLNFASQCRGEDMVLLPTFDRTPLKARSPPQPRFEHHEFGAQGADSRYTVTPDSVLKAVSLRKKFAATSNKQRKKFHLSNEMLSVIKQSALKDDQLRKCSTFEALAALLWRAHVGSFTRSAQDKSLVKMRFLMDTRNILRPPLGQEFCGNAVYIPTLFAKVDELLTEPLGVTVGRIQGARESITEEYVRSGMDFLELHPDYWYHPDCDTIINAWPRAMRYSTDLDFGWGKPVRVEYPMHPGNKSIIFFPFSATDGLDVSVCLEPHQFATFERLFTGVI